VRTRTISALHQSLQGSTISDEKQNKEQRIALKKLHILDPPKSIFAFLFFEAQMMRCWHLRSKDFALYTHPK
jgi:hypothetical protein